MIESVTLRPACHRGSNRGGLCLLLVQPRTAFAASWRGNSTKHNPSGWQRIGSYLTYVPANLPPQSALVIVLHGSGMDGARIRLCTGYEFDRLADQHGFVVLYPDGYRRNWNDCRKNATFPAKRENIDDMSFMRELITRHGRAGNR